MVRYAPESAMVSPRFAGVRTFMRLPHARVLKDVDFVVAGVPFDTGASYRVGARFGPSAIRHASALLRPYNFVQGVDIFEHCSGVDYGDLPVVPGFIEPSYERIEQGLAPILEAGVIPIVLGGDHSIALAELRAVAKVHGPVALVQFDSHSDTWDEYWGQKYTHGTPFRRAVEEKLLDVKRSVQIGLRGPVYEPGDIEAAREMGFTVWTATEVRKHGTEAVIADVRARTGDGPIFLSFDVDFLDPAYAPGTGTPEVGGFTTTEAQELVRGLAGLNFVAFDVVEVLPQYDHGEITSLAAANIAYEFITAVAMRKRG